MDVGCKVSENCLSFHNIDEATAAVDDYQERETASFSVCKVEKTLEIQVGTVLNSRIWPGPTSLRPKKRESLFST